MDVPVLIVYWVEETQSLYGRWAHTLGREPGLRRGAKTTTVVYSDQDLLTSTADQIMADVFIARMLRAGHLPQPMALRVRVDESFTDASQAEVVVRLRSLVTSRSLGSVVEVLPVGSGHHRPEFLVHLSRDRSTILRASLPIDIASVRITMPADTYSHDHDGAALRALISDMLVAMAVALQRTGARAPASRLLDRIARESTIAALPELAPALAELLDEHEMADEAVALSSRLMTAEDSDVRDASDEYLRVALQHIGRVDETSVASLLEQMRRRIHQEAASTDPRRAGRVHYNVAKMLGSTDEHQLMLAEFDAALAHDPGYRDRGYFFRERGGVRWLTGDHLGAAEDYRRALQLGFDPAEMQPLLIDTLMWAGCYSEASEISAGWRPSDHRSDSLAILDGIALGELVRTVGLARQERRPADVGAIERAAGDVGRCTELLRESDALDPRIWIHLVQGEQPPTPRLILLALVCEDLVLPWAMATIATFMAEEAPSAFSDVVTSAVVRTDRDAYLTAVKEMAGEALDAPSAARLRAAVYEHVASISDQQDPITVRVIEDTEPG